MALQEEDNSGDESGWLSLSGFLLVVLIALLAMVARELIRLVSASSKPPPRPVPKREPLPFRTYTLEQLSEFNGMDKEKPVLLAIKGKVYDVSRSDMYRPGSSYSIMAGRDATIALARSSLDEKDAVSSEPISALSAGEKDTLDEWEGFFSGKYDVVGDLQTTTE